MEMPKRAGFLSNNSVISGTPFFVIILQFSSGFKENIYEETLAFSLPKWYLIFVMNMKMR